MNYSELKKQIKSSRLSRKEIAMSANVTPKTIDNILAGSDLKVSTLEALCRVVGIRISVLFDEELTEIRQAGRDYVESGKIEHKGTEYNGPSPVDGGLAAENAELRRRLIEAQDKIIKLMEKNE